VAGDGRSWPEHDDDRGGDAIATVSPRVRVRVAREREDQVGWADSVRSHRNGLVRPKWADQMGQGHFSTFTIQITPKFFKIQNKL
jgi:hypothetical protein